MQSRIYCCHKSGGRLVITQSNVNHQQPTKQHLSLWSSLKSDPRPLTFVAPLEDSSIRCARTSPNDRCLHRVHCFQSFTCSASLAKVVRNSWDCWGRRDTSNQTMITGRSPYFGLSLPGICQTFQNVSNSVVSPTAVLHCNGRNIFRSKYPIKYYVNTAAILYLSSATTTSVVSHSSN